MEQPPSVLMVGTGEYTTGLVHVSGSKSDKKIGVVGVTLFDLRSPHRGTRLGKLKMVGTNGTKFPAIREHLKKNIQDVYKDISVDFESFPSDTTERDPSAFITALATMSPGDLVIIFTPDDTHYQIAKEALSRKIHVLVTKPAVKTLKEHHDLIKLSRENNLVSAIEVHKRWDPIYAGTEFHAACNHLDARHKIRSFGDFSYMCAYMSQPKYQLDTFKYWAGKSSDISYYLNSHHIDFLCWSLQGIAKPVTVFAMKSTGVATSPPYELVPGTEDSITLTVQFLNTASGNLGTAIFTSAWIAPKSDCHSQQRFFYMGHKGEINVDQAHRGYSIATDDNGLQAVNPLFMKYSPDEFGRFAGQRAYGYLSIEAFVDAATQVRNGKANATDFDKSLATLATTSTVTAVLEAGRLSLDSGSVPVKILYEDETNSQVATSISLVHPK